VNTGYLLADIKDYNFECSIESAQFSPDGEQILIKTCTTVKLWDVITGDSIVELKGHTSNINDVQFSPDGKFIITASDDQTAKIWNAKSGAFLFDIAGHLSRVHSAQFSADSKMVISTCDSVVKISETNTGREIISINGANDNFTFNFAKFNPDGKTVVTVSEKNTAKIWDATNGVLLINLLLLDPSSAEFSPEGNKIIFVKDSVVLLLNAHTGASLFKLNLSTNNGVTALFSKDGKKIITTSYNNGIKIWDADNGNLIVDLGSLDFTVNSAASSPDGQKFMTTSYNSTPKVWDANTGFLLQDLRGHSSAVSYSEFSSGDKKILTVSSDGRTKTWDAKSAVLDHVLEGSGNPIFTAHFSSDGKRILIASSDSTAKIWNVSDGLIMTRLKESN
jgi:WD40 repeat protein